MKVESIEYKGFAIEVHRDDDPVDPREEDNVGVMICSHNRYTLGDEQVQPDDAFPRMAKIKRSGGIVLPLYLYDHSGITISTKPFSCPWDSGQVGFIYCTKEQIDDEWDGDYERAESYLVSEVDRYDLYLTGEVYGFIIKDPDGDDVDSCWGYYGNYMSYMIPECRSVVDYNIKNRFPLFKEVVA